MKINKLQNLLEIAKVTAKNSHDEETKVGSILVNKATGAILSTGYNGFVRGAFDHILPKTRPEKYPYMIHAEANVIFNAVKHGVSTDNCSLVNTLSPCSNCMRAAWQSGIDTIYFPSDGIYRDFEDHIKMGDLNVDLEKLGTEFTKITLSAKMERK